MGRVAMGQRRPSIHPRWDPTRSLAICRHEVADESPPRSNISPNVVAKLAVTVISIFLYGKILDFAISEHILTLIIVFLFMFEVGMLLSSFRMVVCSIGRP